MKRRKQRFATSFVFTVLILASACGIESPTATEQVATPDSNGSYEGLLQSLEMVDAAQAFIGFLQGSVEFDQIELADEVTLYLAEEGVPTGEKTSLVLDRDDLHDPANWVVYSPYGQRNYPFNPPPMDADLKTAVGVHFKCSPTTLAEHNFPELARLPHVGTMLYPKDAVSCLESWNLTLVFDPELQPPTLIAVVYAQWEW